LLSRGPSKRDTRFYYFDQSFGGLRVKNYKYLFTAKDGWLGGPPADQRAGRVQPAMGPGGAVRHYVQWRRADAKRRYVLTFFQKLSPCLVGIEACASSHYWSRELKALGHTVRLMPPAYVKPYVKRQKNDVTDPEAICEAVRRPSIRFVETKTPEQQSCLMLHRTRHLLLRQQNAVTNALRAHLAEFGMSHLSGAVALKSFW
jgi:hypothetical protein